VEYKSDVSADPEPARHDGAAAVVVAPGDGAIFHPYLGPTLDSNAPWDSVQGSNGPLTEPLLRGVL
jgi:hypothetical protein